MARIFLMLALFAVTLLAVNLALGLSLGDYNQTVRRAYDTGIALRVLEQGRAAQGRAVVQGARAGVELAEAQAERTSALEALDAVASRASLHRLLGVGAALASILVNSITVTYFIGTNRWCREVADSYGLGDDLVDRSSQLKRRAFPWALAGILTTVSIAALGAASDPTAVLETAPRFVTAHYLAAVLGVAFIAYAFLRQVAAVGANYEVIEAILASVREIRRDQGLDD